MANEKYMDFYTKSEIDAMLNGLSFIKMTKDAYDALTTYDPNTVYYVYDDNGNITQYMGDAQLSSGTSVDTMTALQQGIAPNGLVGTVSYINN